MPFLLATASVYLFITELRDTHGKALACHTVCLALAFTCLAATQLAGHAFPTVACNIMGEQQTLYRSQSWSTAKIILIYRWCLELKNLFFFRSVISTFAMTLLNYLCVKLHLLSYIGYKSTESHCSSCRWQERKNLSVSTKRYSLRFVTVKKF